MSSPPTFNGIDAADSRPLFRNRALSTDASSGNSFESEASTASPQEVVRPPGHFVYGYDCGSRADPFTGPGEARRQICPVWRKLVECNPLNIEKLCNPPETVLYIRVDLLLWQVNKGGRQIGKQTFDWRYTKRPTFNETRRRRRLPTTQKLWC